MAIDSSMTGFSTVAKESPVLLSFMPIIATMSPAFPASTWTVLSDCICKTRVILAFSPERTFRIESPDSILPE
ncbi:hypothetical protein D9M72_409440 [compost metagenome]